MSSPTQAALSAMDKYFDNNKDWQMPLHRARFRAIIRAYGNRWEDKDIGNYNVLAVEELMMAPIKNLENGKDSGFYAGGKIDAVIEEKTGGHSLVILDHKFLSTAFSPEKAQHLTIDGQPSQYAYLCWAEGIKVTHCMWDVVVKSLHRKGKNESYEELEERIYNIYIADADRFGRYKVPIIKENIAEYVTELYQWAKEIGIEAKGSIHLKSRGHCFEFNRPCQYLSLCTGYSDVNDGTWEKLGSVHKELELPEGVNPFNIITNSRLKTYQTCRQLHEYRCNQGLYKIREDQEEPLYCGQAGHAALQSYWESVAGKNV